MEAQSGGGRAVLVGGLCVLRGDQNRAPSGTETFLSGSLAFFLPGPHTEEAMAAVLRSVHRVRVKALKRVQRNIGPFETHVWEPVEDDKPAAGPGFEGCSSPSRSTLTDPGTPPGHSEADSLSEAPSVGGRSGTHCCGRYSRVRLVTGGPLPRKKCLSVFMQLMGWVPVPATSLLGLFMGLSTALPPHRTLGAQMRLCL